MSGNTKVATALAVFMLAFGSLVGPASALGTINRTTNGCNWSTNLDYFVENGRQGIQGITSNGCNRFVSVRVSSFRNGTRTYTAYTSRQNRVAQYWLPASVASPQSNHRLCATTGATSCTTVTQF